MKVGTKSVLFGVHCFAIHPVLIFIAWWRLYGFPWDPRLWVAFLVHDIGYWGKPNMDGREGERHPYAGAEIMGWLFGEDWYWFTLLHSRYLARRLDKRPSKLSVADKYVAVIEPSWLYLPRAIASGEIKDYFEQGMKCNPWAVSDVATRAALIDMKVGATLLNSWRWHRGLRNYMKIWVQKHKTEQLDTMTKSRGYQ